MLLLIYACADICCIYYNPCCGKLKVSIWTDLSFPVKHNVFNDI